MGNPKLLLLDEPSLGLAPKVFDTILERVRVIHARRRFDPDRRAERAQGAAHRRPLLRAGERQRSPSKARRRSCCATRESSKRISERDIDMEKMIDIHSHWGTKRGYTLRTTEELAQQKKTWNSEPTYATEDEMADVLPAAAASAYDPRFRLYEVHAARRGEAVHDYGFETQRAHPGRDPRATGFTSIRTPGPTGVRELRRCIDHAPGFIGFAVSGSGSGPAERSGVEAVLRAVHRSGDPGADLRRHDRTGCGIARRRRDTARRLPSAPSRSGRGASFPGCRSSPRDRAGHGRPRRSRS